LNVQAQELRSRLDRYYGFLKQDRSNPNLITEVADLHLQLGEFLQARQVLENALSQWPDHAALKSRLATAAIASNQAGEAISLLQELMRGGTDNPVIRYNLAYALMLTSRFAEAKDLLIPIANSTEAPEAPLLLAQALHHLGEMEEAIKQVQAYLASAPNDANALGLLALLNLDVDDSVASKEAAEKALTANPDNLNALVSLGSLALAEQDEEQAKIYLDRAVTRHPKSGRAWSGRGLAAMLSLDLTHALEYFDQAVQHMPNHIGTWHSLAWCQILNNDLTGAQESFNRAMELDRNFGETHGGLAVVAILQNRLEEAPTMIKRALKLNPLSFAGRFAQSLMTQKSDPKKAQQMIQNILTSSAYPGGEPLKDVLTRVTLKRNNQSRN